MCLFPKPVVKFKLYVSNHLQQTIYQFTVVKLGKNMYAIPYSKMFAVSPVGDCFEMVGKCLCTGVLEYLI